MTRNERTHEVVSKRRVRRGASLVVALVCLTVVMLVAGALVRVLVLRRQAERVSERRLQGDYFAEAAWRRAVSRTKQDPKYVGETWRVTLVDRGAERPAIATIGVVRDAAQPLECVIRVAARWPEDDPAAVVSEVEQRVSLSVPKPNNP